MEVVVPRKVIESVLRTTPEIMVKQRLLNAYGHSTIGQIGTVQGFVLFILYLLSLSLSLSLFYQKKMKVFCDSRNHG